MGWTAIGLALLGFTVGAMSRLKILLLIVGLLLPVSILFARLRGSTTLDAALMLLIAEATVQTSFFSGLVARAALDSVLGVRTAT
jgi:hypothetical protein